jgi:hypothetical protein
MIILLAVSSLFLLYKYKNIHGNKVEFFQDKTKNEYIRILSKLSNLAIQPYRGDLDTYITANTKKTDEYYPQLWVYEQPKGLLKNVATGRYLTVSPDETKVVLSPLAKKSSKQMAQQWTIDTTTGTLRYVGSEDEPGGDYKVTVLADDGDGGFAKWQAGLTVTPGSKAAKAAKEAKGCVNCPGPPEVDHLHRLLQTQLTGGRV